MIHYPQQPARAPRAQRLPPSSPGLAGELCTPCARVAPTCVHPVVGLQLVLQAELLAAAVALVGLLPGVDALVALQGALVPKAAAAELALVGVVACKHTHISPLPHHTGERCGAAPNPTGPRADPHPHAQSPARSSPPATSVFNTLQIGRLINELQFSTKLRII